MAKNMEPADQSAGNDARYEVTLSKRFEYLGFLYVPGHHHEVDKVIFDAMTEEKVVADVKQLS
jgi:hypothetical protein